MWADPRGGKRGGILLRYEDVKSGEGLPVLIVYTGRRLMPVCCQTVAYWQIGGLFLPFNCTFVRNLWNQKWYFYTCLHFWLCSYGDSNIHCSQLPSYLVVFFLFIRQVLCLEFFNGFLAVGYYVNTSSWLQGKIFYFIYFFEGSKMYI